jgi:hypothetical protein
MLGITAMLHRRVRSSDRRAGACPGLRMTTNKAGMLLMHKDLQKHVGSVAVNGSAGAPDSWLQAPDFCSGDKRSRNMIDA